MEENTQGYPVREYHEPVKRYCRTLDLRNDAELIRRYREAHSQEKMWREIIDGIREVGILEMEMYIYESHVFMNVETALDFDWDSAMERLSTLPRQQEWEDYVAALQGCENGMTSTDKWHLMERMFRLY